jgi:hypothetical protein
MSAGQNLPIVDTPQGEAFAAGDVRAAPANSSVIRASTLGS